MSALRLVPALYRLLGPHRQLFWATLGVALLTALWSAVTFFSASVLVQGLADLAELPRLGLRESPVLGMAARLVDGLPKSQRLMLGFVGTAASLLVSSLLALGTLAVNLRFLARFSVHLQGLCFERALAYRMEFHDETRRSQLNQLIVVEARACHSLMKELTAVCANAFRVAVHAAFLLLISPLLTLVAVLIGLSAWQLMNRLNRLNKRWAALALLRRNDLMAATHEGLYGIRQVKLLGATAALRGSFRAAAQGVMRFQSRVSLLVNGQSTVMQAFGLVAVLAVVGLAAALPDTLSPGRVVLFLFVATGTITPIAASAREYGIMNEQVAAVQAVLRFLGEDEAARERDGRLERPVLCREAIVFDRVTVDYPSRPAVLRDVSLVIRRGERVGIVGASGSGKTSLVNLLPRLYDPAQGALRVDGTDLREFRLAWLRKRVGLLSQDVFVFNATVGENIRLGRPEAGAEEVVASARLASAHEFITALPQGYDTPVGDRGVKLSGGQRQRINIAQVFLQDPEILVLDEATSALDSESEALVQDAIARLSKDRTVILVAHRLSTLRDVDRLVVLEAGRVVEEGTWEALLQRGGTFRRLWEMQTSAIG